jgi:hypothetical protein
MNGIYRSAGPGAFVSVQGESDLMSLDVSGLTLGTFAFIWSESLYFQLVLDGADLIWQQVTFSGGGAVHVTAPLTGDGSTGTPLGLPNATDSTAGALSAADKTALDGVPTTYVAKTRNVTTTAPLSGGGSLAGDLTLSIVPATDSVPGSMSASDKTKLDGLPSAAVPTTRNVNTTSPLTGGGALSGDLTLAIPAATDSTPGYMAAADKSKLDGLCAPVTTVISVSPVGHVDFTIAGDLSDYEFTAYVAQPASSGTVYYFLAPQASISVSTRTAMLCGTASGSAVTPTRVLTTWTLAGYVSSSNSWAIFKGRLYCKTGKPRYAHVNGTSQGSGTVSVVNPGSSYVDTETATTWTTIRFASNTANDGSGTEVSTAYGVGTIITMTPIGFTS